MKRLLIAASLIASFGASAELVKFSSGDVLTATDLNNNFTHLEQQQGGAIVVEGHNSCALQTHLQNNNINAMVTTGVDIIGLDLSHAGTTVSAYMSPKHQLLTRHNNSTYGTKYIGESGRVAYSDFNLDVLTDVTGNLEQKLYLRMLLVQPDGTHVQSVLVDTDGVNFTAESYAEFEKTVASYVTSDICNVQ